MNLKLNRRGMCLAFMLIASAGLFAKPKLKLRIDYTEEQKRLMPLGAKKLVQKGEYLKKFSAVEKDGSEHQIVFLDDLYFLIDDSIFEYKILDIMCLHNSKIGYRLNIVNIQDGSVTRITFSRKIIGEEQYGSYNDIIKIKNLHFQGIQPDDMHRDENGKWIKNTYFDYFPVVFGTSEKDVTIPMWILIE